MPAEIADVAEAMWQRALKLAGEAAKHDDNAAHKRLKQIEVENELRAYSLALREREIDTLARERERALSDSRAHEQLLLRTLGRDQNSLRACEAHIAELENQIVQYRQRIETLIAAAVTRNRRRTKQSGQLLRQDRDLAPTPGNPDRRQVRRTESAARLERQDPREALLSVPDERRLQRNQHGRASTPRVRSRCAGLAGRDIFGYVSSRIYGMVGLDESERSDRHSLGMLRVAESPSH